jgi:hypothetical protein
MATTVTISQRELKRVAGAAYEGKRIRVSLANLAAEGYTSESTRANWDSIKISGNGYADFTDVVEVGAYDATDARYEMGGAAGANTFFDAVFTASGGGVGFTFNRIYVVIGTSDGGGGWTEETYIHSLVTESPAITLAPGQSRTYRIQLVTDD